MKRTIIRIFGIAILIFITLYALPSPPVYRVAFGIIIGLPSFVMLLISRRQLGKYFSVMPEAKGLMTTGFYSRIQHPMYFFLDLFLFAVIIAVGFPILMIIWGVIVIIQLIQSHREEKILALTFGTDYDSYKAKTWF
jgi:protein-S-isoprenylcysteine O-methyltransferase Ste14